MVGSTNPPKNSKSKQEADFAGKSEFGDATGRLPFLLLLFPHGFALRAEFNCLAKQCLFWLLNTLLHYPSE